MHNFVKYIKTVTGLSMGEFCEQELKSDYKAFNWRLKNNRLYPDEILYMVLRTRETVQELFGKDWNELIIDNSNGPLVSTVKDMVKGLSKTQARQLEKLIGLEPYKERPDEVEKPVKKKKVAKKPPRQEDVDPLRKIFKDTY